MESIKYYAHAPGQLDDRMKTPSHGLWKRTYTKAPYAWFFDYFEIEERGTVYKRRVNKLDRAFDWICKKLYWISR